MGAGLPVHSRSNPQVSVQPVFPPPAAPSLPVPRRSEPTRDGECGSDGATPDTGQR